jgi:heme-degrading monooxygenase HmoA
MAVQSIVRVPNLSVEGYDESTRMLGPMVAQQPGFISHTAVRDGDGFVITELWDSEEQARQWYDTTVRPATEQAGISGFQAEFHPVHNYLAGQAR